MSIPATRLSASLALALLLILLPLGSPAPAAATLTVTTTADELNADGDCSLREAIAASNANMPVDACAPGAPEPDMDVIAFGVTGTITLTGGVLTMTEDLTVQGPGATDLVVSGGGATPVLVVDYAERPVVMLSGITVADGVASGTGGGISNGGTLTVENSVVSGNIAFRGGGIVNGSGRLLTVKDSIVNGNSASEFGGGIHNDGILSVIDSTFTGNSAQAGGGIQSFPNTTTVTGSTFTGNSATSGGGGLLSYGPLTVTDSTFAGNDAPDGAGLFASSSTTTVTGSTFAMNEATGGGGGIFNNGTMQLTNSTLWRNSAEEGGGGIRNYFGSLTATNVTLAENSAGFDGGGVLNYFGGTLTLENTIVADSPTGGNCVAYVPITDGGGNLQHPGVDCGGTIPSADPLLDPAGLQANGGPTETIALQVGSPAVDAALAGACPTTDQRGFARPQGPACDTGGLEMLVGVAANIVEPNATVLLMGRLRVNGTLFCGPPGDGSRIWARLDQSATGAVTRVGQLAGTCSGGDDAWTMVLVKQSGSPSFGLGPARACTHSRTYDSLGGLTDSVSACTSVTLVLP